MSNEYANCTSHTSLPKVYANCSYQFRVLKELNHDVKLGLNKFARLASLVCGTKIALVNFLDDKHQYSSAESAPAQWLGHTAIPRGLSVCAHAILRRSNDIFEIPDMAQDWRFREKVCSPLPTPGSPSALPSRWLSLCVLMVALCCRTS